MLQKYCVFGVTGNDDFYFDDTRSVQELIECVFRKYDYYEPIGMEYVTLFQCHSERSDCGWFTTDKSKSCAEEITNPDELCIAYNVQGVFYFAEGGWGHHMIDLGNAPVLQHPVSIHLRFSDDDNVGYNETIVIAGHYTFMDVVSFLKKYGYIQAKCGHIIINATNPYREPYTISFENNLLRMPLSEFEKTLPDSAIFIDIK